jgi:hypothetical protein
LNGTTVRLAALCLALALAASASARPAAAQDSKLEKPTASGTTIGKIQILPVAARCAVSVEDVAVAGQCTQASSTPELGRLYPITQELFVSPTGEVGIGTTLPDEALTVQGRILSTTGGFRFPDGSLQATVQVQGPAGAPGVQGPQGPPGATGPPGIPGVTALNGLTGPSVNLVAGSPNLLVSGFANTITVSAASTPCTYSSKTYTTNQFCYTWPDAVPCSFGFRQKKLVCQADGHWQVITSSACNSPSLLPICGS